MPFHTALPAIYYEWGYVEKQMGALWKYQVKGKRWRQGWRGINIEQGTM